MILEELVGLMDIGCEAMSKSFEGLNICELGDQRMKWHPAQTGKKYLIEKGVAEHVSIDWNGKNGALKRNLAEPINEWFNYFDMVTDFGTIEHVDGGQYSAFKNVHDFTKVGGVMVHALPLVGYLKGHCNYHYQESFPSLLASNNNYKCVVSEIRDIYGRKGKQCLICFVLLKLTDKDFIVEEGFNSIGGIEGIK